MSSRGRMNAKINGKMNDRGMMIIALIVVFVLLFAFLLTSMKSKAVTQLFDTVQKGARVETGIGLHKSRIYLESAFEYSIRKHVCDEGEVYNDHKGDFKWDIEKAAEEVGITLDGAYTLQDCTLSGSTDTCTATGQIIEDADGARISGDLSVKIKCEDTPPLQCEYGGAYYDPGDAICIFNRRQECWSDGISIHWIDPVSCTHSSVCTTENCICYNGECVEPLPSFSFDIDAISNDEDNPVIVDERSEANFVSGNDYKIEISEGDATFATGPIRYADRVKVQVDQGKVHRLERKGAVVSAEDASQIKAWYDDTPDKYDDNGGKVELTVTQIPENMDILYVHGQHDALKTMSGYSVSTATTQIRCERDEGCLFRLQGIGPGVVLDWDQKLRDDSQERAREVSVKIRIPPMPSIAYHFFNLPEENSYILFPVSKGTTYDVYGMFYDNDFSDSKPNYGSLSVQITEISLKDPKYKYYYLNSKDYCSEASSYTINLPEGFDIDNGDEFTVQPLSPEVFYDLGNSRLHDRQARLLDDKTYAWLDSAYTIRSNKNPKVWFAGGMNTCNNPEKRIGHIALRTEHIEGS